MPTTIFVMTHKAFDIPKEKHYHALQVGAAMNGFLGMPYVGDNSGDNISDLNWLFGELTGFYWIWQNYAGRENIAINHYRRFFRGKNNGLMTESEYDEILSHYDVIATNAVEGDLSHYEAYKEAHNIHDMDAVGAAVKKLYPEMYPAFREVMQLKSGYFGNLCAMSRELFDAYCEFIFTVFTEASAEIDVSTYDAYHARVYGFLSEPLLQVFIKHHGLSVHENPVIYTEEKKETTELKLAIGQLIKLGQYDEADRMYHEFIKIRPDVLLPLSDIKGELPIIEKILYILKLERDNNVPGLKEKTEDLYEMIKIYRDTVDSMKKGESPEGISEYMKEVIRKNG